MLEVDQQSFDFLVSKLAGGPSRIVFRETDAMDPGPIRAWQFSTASENVAGQNLWELDSDGTCDPTSSSPYTGVLAELDSVPAPPDGSGPLTIGQISSCPPPVTRRGHRGAPGWSPGKPLARPQAGGL